MFLSYWLALFVLCGLVTFLLVWGMKRHDGAQVRVMVEEIRADDPEPMPVFTAHPSAGNLAATLADRDFVLSFWGRDAPDLIVARWKTGGAAAPAEMVSYHQLFLPIGDDPGQLGAAIESHLFEGACAQGIPENSRFVSAMTFAHAQTCVEDVIVETRFEASDFVHRFHAADPDGRLLPMPEDDPLMSAEAAMAPGAVDHRAYRRMLHTLLETGDAEQAREELDALVGGHLQDGHAWAWLALLAARERRPRGEVARFTALAQEYAPASRLLRLAAAEMEGATGLDRWLREVTRDFSCFGAPQPRAGFLVAQGLLALRQHAAARALCEQHSRLFPSHRESSRLLHVIQHSQRGAQT